MAVTKISKTKAKAAPVAEAPAANPQLVAQLASAPAGTVLEAPSPYPHLSPEKLVVTVVESVFIDAGRRLTVRLHWHGVLLAQKVATIVNDKLEWAHA